MTRLRQALAGTLAGALLAAGPVSAGPPSDQLRAQVDRVLRILEDPELRKDGRARDRRAAIRQVANNIFDFREIGQRSLGRHWQARTPAERDEFVALFGDLLEHSYVSKIEGYSGEKIAFVGEALDGEVATVRTRIVTRQATEIPVDYRMFRRDDRWLAYDVFVEGVSLVANYRTQFDRVIQRSSYPDLARTLRTKQDERLAAAGRGRERRVAPVAETAAARVAPRQSQAP